ncbi:MAG: RagB/SusD family nutrient uptake outer membrane protein [Dysgonomonas sp.]
MKTYIKTIKNISLSIVIAAGFTSCEDFLDKGSMSSFEKENAFETVYRAEMSTMGVYTNMRNNEILTYMNYGTDEAQSSAATSNSANQTANYEYSATSINKYMNTLYIQIGKANECIKQIPQMPQYSNGSESDKAKLKKYLGEALTLRAIYYLDLIRLWGDVPYVTEPVNEKKPEIRYPRTNRDTIYDGIIKDLQLAEELVPWQSETGTTSERISKQAVKAFLARTALYAAGYSLRWDLNSYDQGTVKMARRADQARINELYRIARKAAYDIIEHNENDLNDSFEQVFRNYATKVLDSKETIFEIGQNGSVDNNIRVGYTNGMKINQNSIYGKGEPNGYVLPTFYYSFADGDLRRDVSITNYEITYNGTTGNSELHIIDLTNFRFGKFRLPWKKTKSDQPLMTSINWPMMRYSDVLLMFAEADNEVNHGPSAEAVKQFEKVRTRAFGGDASKIGATPTDYDGFFKAVVQERAWELAFEDYRKTDLIRWNILGETIADTKANLAKIAKREAPYNTIEEARAYKVEIGTYEDKHVKLDYIPVSASEIAAGYTPPTGYKLKTYNNLKTDAKDGFIVNFARSYEANKVELYPINQEIMDLNKGFAGQQHPKY